LWLSAAAMTKPADLQPLPGVYRLERKRERQEAIGEERALAGLFSAKRSCANYKLSNPSVGPNF